MSAQILLASASPRRQELLTQIGVSFKMFPVDIDETPYSGEAPLSYVRRIAAEKSAVALERSDARLPILAADTAVILGGRIMGKPKDKADCLAMLGFLSGRTHQVFSAISLRGSEHWQAVSITDVTFRSINEEEMNRYWQSGEPADKAGAYAIQGLGSVFVKSITGSFSGVVGLPLFETAELLAKQGITIFK
ncbi:Maf family protein [Methylotuvimicrobium buryatense]|uniref:dTTP/UTP pyrophosphatase n=1 Tax=Methylotuvimicrobium buryatense TaxID=95641 RepID=A0A4V1IK80_METBY|nr:Maf family protein [Methylotuvimicrobium buryatense]QCW83975.1 septum formation inhibitor Maf [Methylotuvimicrobium buryatense]